VSIVYVPTLKSTRMQDVADAIDESASPGRLEIGTAGMGTVLVAITLEKPSFSEDGEGVLSMLGLPLSGTAVATGVAAAARFANGDGAFVATGLTVGLNGADINISNVDLQVGDIVPITEMTIAHS
jgi:hypothetical protein